MKGISKIVLAVTIGLFVMVNSWAAAPTYNKISKQSPNGKYSEVLVVNETMDTYSVYSIYKDSGRVFYMPLNEMGTSKDAIKYQLIYPDYAVCLDVIQNSIGKRIYRDCLTNGKLTIHYSEGNKAVIVSKQ